MQIDLTAKEIALCVTALNHLYIDVKTDVLNCAIDDSDDDLVYCGVLTAVRDRLYEYILDPDGKLDRRDWLQHRNVWSVRKETPVVVKTTKK